MLEPNSGEDVTIMPAGPATNPSPVSVAKIVSANPQLFETELAREVASRSR
jgi:hypothetical protein